MNWRRASQFFSRAYRLRRCFEFLLCIPLTAIPFWSGRFEKYSWGGQGSIVLYGYPPDPKVKSRRNWKTSLPLLG